METIRHHTDLLICIMYLKQVGYQPNIFKGKKNKTVKQQQVGEKKSFILMYYSITYHKGQDSLETLDDKCIEKIGFLQGLSSFYQFLAGETTIQPKYLG